MGSSSTLLSEATSTDYNAHLSENYTSVPYGFQPKATYTHAKSNTDIMGGQWTLLKWLVMTLSS